METFTDKLKPWQFAVAVATGGGGGALVSPQDGLLAMLPFASVTLAVKLSDTADCGKPEIAPVEELRVTPGGSDPVARE